MAKPLVAAARARLVGKPHAEVTYGQPRILTLDEVIKSHVLDTLKRLNGNRMQAAVALGIDRRTLYDWLKKWGEDKRPVKEFVK